MTSSASSSLTSASRSSRTLLSLYSESRSCIDNPRDFELLTYSREAVLLGPEEHLGLVPGLPVPGGGPEPEPLPGHGVHRVLGPPGGDQAAQDAGAAHSLGLGVTQVAPDATERCLHRSQALESVMNMMNVPYDFAQ